ncbi:MAG: Hpt domain-containing protein, partial [Frankiaceae bacterium]|nr:Hpt domain-containing protein [Frankiaceae bacterium]
AEVVVAVAVAVAVDPSVLQALTARMGARGPELIDRLLDTWEAETDQRLDELRTAVAADDAQAVGRVAHAMRGGSGSLGAVGLAAVCRDVEEELRAGRAVDLRAAAARIQAATAGARTGLAQLRVGSGG